ncbi:MAG: membrane dipeptidase [SAR202 cluster bacterium]|nr:membrane dipeptidase [SAR202 cluster bacterium]
MISERARKLDFSSYLVDTHSDALAWPTRHQVDIGVRQDGKTQQDLPRMREGNMNIQFFAAFPAPQWIEKKMVIQTVLRYFDSFYTLCRNYPDQIEQARTVADAKRIVASGRIAGILCIEGGHAIEDDLAVLRMYYELGARYMTLTWNNSNNWADGVLAEPKHNGLTDFGREVVREMNRLGMIVDISHVAPKTFWDAIETTSKPVIASHSSCKAICGAPRNMDDNQLRAVKQNGGVVGVNFERTFVSERYRLAKLPLDEQRTAALKAAEQANGGKGEAFEAAKKKINEEYKSKTEELQPPHWKEIVDHIDHMVEVMGVDHVGIGSDFDGADMPEGMEDCSKMPLLTQEMLDRGYSEGDVKKILGENTLRVMTQVFGG